MKSNLLSLSILLLLQLVLSNTVFAQHTAPADTLHYKEEIHFSNLRQLTFGGDNAEAYFSFDGKWLVFQRTNPKENIS